jgi:hypothetical protein
MNFYHLLSIFAMKVAKKGGGEESKQFAVFLVSYCYLKRPCDTIRATTPTCHAFINLDMIDVPPYQFQKNNMSGDILCCVTFFVFCWLTLR